MKPVIEECYNSVLNGTEVDIVIKANSASDYREKLNKELGITILLVEQNAKLALNLSSRSYIMENGKIVMEGKSEKNSFTLIHSLLHQWVKR